VIAMTKLRYLLIVIAAACDAAGAVDSAPPSKPALAPPAQPPPPTKGSDMTDTRDKLPANFDVRVTRTLALPVPDSIAIEFDSVGMTKSPTYNYRLQLASDGSVFYVQHSGKPGDWQMPFDQPLPAKPVTQLAAADVAAVVAKLDAGGFFAHPGYEANPRVEDGSFWIVRARHGKTLQSVVFQNTKPAYVDALAAIAQPLWHDPK
jgi:hypothetical protein